MTRTSLPILFASLLGLGVVFAGAPASAEPLLQNRLYFSVAASGYAGVLHGPQGTFGVLSGLPEARIGLAVSQRSQVYLGVQCTLLSVMGDLVGGRANNVTVTTQLTPIEQLPAAAVLGFSTSLGETPFTFSAAAGAGNFLRDTEPPASGFLAGISIGVNLPVLLGGR